MILMITHRKNIDSDNLLIYKFVYIIMIVKMMKT